MSFLDVQAVGKRYGTAAALDGVTLGVAAGSRTAIVGPSGSGKSTLLRLIAGFEAPDSGRILLDGATLAAGPDMVPAHRRGIGIVAQDGALFPHLTVADNIGFGLPRGERDRASRIADLVAMVDLDASLLRRKPDQLSGGQQQRVALARALALRPRLMLLDEPFSALDTGLRVATRKSVEALLGRAGITTILVTHDQEEALSFADQVVVLAEGRLLQAGAPKALYAHPSDRVVAQFLGEAILLPAEIADGWAHCALGRVRTATGGRSGPAEIMLRPEQLRLAPPETGSDAHGAVIDVDFAGAVTTVTLRLEGSGDGRTIRLHAPLSALPESGAVVAIEVEGEAHVFPRPAEEVVP